MIQDEDIQVFDWFLVEGKKLELSPKSHMTTEVQNLKFVDVKSTERASTFKQRLEVQIRELTETQTCTSVRKHLNNEKPVDIKTDGGKSTTTPKMHFTNNTANHRARH